MKNYLQASLKRLTLLLILITLGLFTAKAQWQSVGPDGGYILSLATSGSNIFAGTLGGGVYLSTNNGTSWTEVNNSGLSNTAVTSFAINGSNIFACNGSDVFLSTNNGASWTAVGSGITGNSDINSLAISGSNIFAGTFEGGVFLSTDNGASWTAVNTGLSNTNVTSLAISGSNIFAGTFQDGVYLSTNNGASWTAVNSGLTSTSVTSFAINGSNIFAGTGGGVFLSTNNGTSWTAVNTGLTYIDVTSLAISGSNIFAGTDAGGVFLSTNNGASWTAVNTGLSAYPSVLSLAISGSNIFAGTVNGGVFLSTNNGASWTAVNTGLTNTEVTSFIISGSNIFAGSYGNGVFLSTNNGASWTAVNNSGLSNDVFSLAISGSTIFAGAANGDVFLSTNNGASWTAVNISLTNTFVYSLAISGSNIFAGTDGGGVFLSTNNGASWTAVNTGLSDYHVLSLAISGSNIFAGTRYDGVFLSTNNGASWMSVNNSGLSNAWVKSLAISGSNIFAGTYGGGVYLSTNNGASWTAVNSGLSNVYVTSLAISGSNIFASTNAGVYLSTNNGASWTAVNTGLPAYFYFTSLAISGSNIFASSYYDGVFVGGVLCLAGTATAAGATSPNYNTVICNNTSTTITLTGASAGTIQWQQSVDGETNWANVTGGTGATTATYTTPNLTTTTYYRALVTNSCYEISSNTAIVYVSAVPNVTLTNVTPTSVTVSWTPFAVNSNVLYSVTSSGAGSGTINPAGSPQAITVTPGAALNVTVTQVNPAGCAVSGNASINTELAAPTLTLGTATADGFTASWTPVTGAASYTLTYKFSANTTTWKTVTTSNTSVVLTGLYHGATYLCTVVANASGYTGAASSEELITTLPSSNSCTTPTFSVTSNCSNEINVTMSGSPSSLYRITFTRVSPNPSAGASYNVSGSSVTVVVGAQFASSVWQVLLASNCSGVFSVVAQPQYVVIKPACPQLQNLVLSTPNCDGFEATWNASTCISPADYYIFIKRQGATGYDGYSVGANPYVYAGWLGANTYNAYVTEAACGTTVAAPSTVQTITTGVGCRTEEEVQEADNSSSNDVAEQGDAVMNIYPNPTNGNFMVNVYTKNKPDEMIQIEMVNTLGQVVYTVIAPVTNGTSNNVFQVPENVSSGLYMIHTVAGGENLTKQIIYTR